MFDSQRHNSWAGSQVAKTTAIDQQHQTHRRFESFPVHFSIKASWRNGIAVDRYSILQKCSPGSNPGGVVQGTIVL